MAIDKIRSINGKAIEDYELKQNVLTKDNNTEYTPTGNYNPVTKKYVDDKVAGIVDSAPETLDTLKKLSTALGDNPNFATSVANQLGNKVDKVKGKGLSTNDLTTNLKNNYDAAYTHSTSAHAPSNAQKNSDITKAEIEAKLTGTITSHKHEEATSTNAGFMSADDKSKLIGISPGANNYSHPDTHPASMITTTSDEMFVSQTEKNTWNAKASSGDVLTKDNTTEYTPTEDYNPATKKYVDDTIQNLGTYSMQYNEINDRLEFVYTPKDIQ